MTSMTKVDQRPNRIDILKARVHKLFGFKKISQQSDYSATDAHREARHTQSDWFQQTHGNANDGIAKQKGSR